MSFLVNCHYFLIKLMALLIPHYCKTFETQLVKGIWQYIFHLAYRQEFSKQLYNIHSVKCLITCPVSEVLKDKDTIKKSGVKFFSSELISKYIQLYVYILLTLIE